MAELAHSVNGVPIILTDQGWGHIRDRHPEIERQEQVLEAIERPELIQRGDFGALMAVLSLEDVYLVVVYREVTSSRGFVITAYLAERLRGREILWIR